MQRMTRWSRALRVAGALVVSAAIAGDAAAQSSPYVGDTGRTIKALGDAEIRDLQSGAGMGFALAAELNGLPGPRHVIDLAAELDVGPEQALSVQDVFDRMERRAVDLGRRIVAAEAGLDSMFAAGIATVDEVRRRSIELGRLYGELRAVHLGAHIETLALMSPEQVAAYQVLRGYAGNPAEETTGAAHEHDSSGAAHRH